jgi:hypothetical protein
MSIFSFVCDFFLLCFCVYCNYVCSTEIRMDPISDYRLLDENAGQRHFREGKTQSNYIVARIFSFAAHCLNNPGSNLV